MCPNPVISVHRKLAETPIFVSLPFSALTLLVGQQEGHPACRKAGRWLVGSHHLTGALHILQLQLSPPPPSSLAPIKYILVPANPGPTGKWPLKWRERERVALACAADMLSSGRKIKGRCYASQLRFLTDTNLLRTCWLQRHSQSDLKQTSSLVFHTV